MPGEDLILSDANRTKLDGIVQQMSQNNEPDENIQAVVGDFKQKYGEKKKPQIAPAPLLSASSGLESASTAGGSVPSGINYLAGQNFTEPAPVQGDLTDPSVTSQLQSASTPATIVPKDQSQFDPNIQQKATGPLMGDKTEALMRGAARLGSSVLKTPGFLYDVATAATNNIINRPLGINDTPTSKQIGEALPDFMNVTTPLDQAVSHSEEKFQKKYDKGVSEYFSNGDYKKGFDLLATSIAETAPVTIALMMGNAAGITAGQSVATGGAVFGADKMTELDNNPNISQEQKVMVAAANGLMEGAFEQFGLTKLGAVTRDVLKKSGAEAAKKIAEEGFKASYGKILKQYLGTSAEEALTEAATQFSQNAIDKYSGANPELDLKTGVVDAAIIGLGAGASMASPTTLLSVVKTKKAMKQAAALADQKKALEEDLQVPEVPDDVKSSISKKIRDINEQEADIASQEKEKFNNLTDEGKQQVDALLQKSNEISSVITNENVSDDTRESFKKDLDAIDNEIDKVYETATKPAEPEVADQEITSEDTEAEIAYLNELRDAFGLEESELARLIELQSAKVNNNEKEQYTQGEEVRNDNPTKQDINQDGITGTGSPEPISTDVQQENQERPTENTSVTGADLQAVAEEEIIQESPEQQTINTDQNGQETENKNQEADVLAPVEPAAEDINEENSAPAATQPQNELIDEEDQQEDVKDSPAAKESLDRDIEAIKQMKTKDLAEKKFVGMIERAWKAKEDGKISRKTYTAFRNKAKDILEGKVRAKDSVDATEAKLRSTAAINKVRERLLGQGYKKIVLSSPIPITPKTIDDLLTLTNRLIHRGIDAGYTIQEATQKALKAIKLNPAYKRLVGEGKDVDEKTFDEAVNSSLKPKNPKNKQPETPKDKEQPADISGPLRKKKTVARVKESARMKDIAKELDPGAEFYQSVSVPKLKKYVNDILDSYQKENLLEDLAKEMIEGRGDFNPKITPWIARGLSDRLRILAENEGNEMQKSSINKLAAKLETRRAININEAATITGLEAELAKELPLSEEGLKEFVKASLENVQDTYFSEANKKDSETALKDFSDIIQSEEAQNVIREAVDAEINRIAEATKGKEWVQAVDSALDALKIDLTDC